jgi:hypothetical protein
MSNAPQQPDPTHQLARDIHCRAVETLRTMLPPPIDDTFKARTRRDRAALAAVATLVPASPAEAHLAARHVAAGEHAQHCLRLAGQLRAQAASMGRESRRYHAALLRMQAQRGKLEARTPPMTVAR